MKSFYIITLAITLSCFLKAQTPINQGFMKNRPPLIENRYSELPIGNIEPTGWLREMLIRQKNGATGHLDEMYPLVMGNRNGWLGGDGDQWERGPYWIDGLLPLAYILKDEELIAKVKPWIEWTLRSQRPDGYFGPSTDYPPEPGLQRNNCGDWWPKMVMLKVMKQYFSATQDPRVIPFLTKYFRYQLQHLNEYPLDHWTFWARYRAGDNLQIVYWLYNITGDKFLLELADLLHKQTYDYTNAFLNTGLISTQGDMHCVNLAQGIKEPLIYYQRHPERKYYEAVKKGLSDIRTYMGQPQGMYGGDENIRNGNPVNGSELCSAVELMFSLESMLSITGDLSFSDHLERIAFNALPAQVNDEFTARQYFQQPNQVMITRHTRNFNVDHQGTDICFGLLTGYPCCTSNMHQGWPKFTQNLWYATSDGGLAAFIFSPCRVTTPVGNGKEVTIEEITNYPFSEQINFVITHKEDQVEFPLYLRIPDWCSWPEIKINGKPILFSQEDSLRVINRSWNNNDTLQLVLPMHIKLSRWYENSVSVEHGPLVYALKIKEKWIKLDNKKDPVRFGDSYFEVLPETDWNYGLPEAAIIDTGKFRVIPNKKISRFPWNQESAPMEIMTMARKIRNWKLYNDSAGPLPYSVQYGADLDPEEEEISLIPYGCTTLRISEFPVLAP